MSETVIQPEPQAIPAPRKSGIMVAALVVSSVAVAVGTAGLTFGIIERSHVASRATQISALLHQQAVQTRQQAVLAREMATIQPKLAGTARDVITCGDLQNMFLQDTYGVSLSQDASGNISASLNQNPVALPAHCINH